MRAAVLTAYGSPHSLQIQQVLDPRPGPGQVLVRVHCSTVTHGDTELRAANMPWLFQLPVRLWLGLLRPRPGLVLGMEVAGVVEAVGDGVHGFEVGDEVFAATGMGLGAHAEQVCVSVDGLIGHKPAGVPFEQVVALPIGALAALGYLRKGGLRPGARVLVRGASGSIGSYAVQLARHEGAHVTAVGPPQSLERMRALGADEVVDYTQHDVFEDHERYDLVLDVVGRASLSRCLRIVAPGGAYVRATVPGLGEVLRALIARLGAKRVVMGDAGGTAEDLALLGERVEQGVLTTLIERRWPLEQIALAHAYTDTGHKQGNVIVDVVTPVEP